MTRLMAKLAAFLLIVLWAASAQALVLIDESFQKDASGQIEEVRSFSGSAGAAVIVFKNGGETFDRVRQGKISLNGEPLFGSQDFKINGSISKTVALLAGNNTLTVELSGQVGGQMRVSVIQGGDQPVLTFPTGTVHVSTLGDDSSTCGTVQQSCRTITHGLQRAAQIQGPLVAVAGGIYNESIALISGIHLLSGFNDEFSQRHIPTLRAVVRGAATSLATVSAINISDPTLFEGFFILGPTVTTPSRNSIGVLIRNSTSNLVIQNNIILGGVGGMGAAGNHSSNGASGAPGAAGGSAGSAFVAGGGGGTMVLGGSGGSGGHSTTPVWNPPSSGTQNGSGTTGQPGAGIGGGSGGGLGTGGFHGLLTIVNSSCVYLQPSNGSNHAARGADGGHGGNGGAGGGGSDGTLIAGSWVSTPGASGIPGRSGGGGGGGGAGGGAAASAGCAAVFGPSGGGGGSGAGGGGGGTGGSGGGASMGVFVFLPDSSSKPVIGANQIYLGVGGAGGSGGNGGVGGFGGLGGAGGAALFGTGNAGGGGVGGNGGHGGGGGGGAGGPAIGLAANFEHSLYGLNNDIFTATGTGGLGGVGGLSLANPGAAGQPGQLMAIRSLP